MKSITIKGSKRESVGKVATKALRNAGSVPCVIVRRRRTSSLFSTGTCFQQTSVHSKRYTATCIELETDRSKCAFLQDIQFHPLTDKILHVDFYRIFDDKEVTMEIPVH